MRRDLLALAVTAALAAGQAQSGSSRSAPPEVGPGRVAWFDLTTTDLSRSRGFYGRLFGWTFTALQGTDQAVGIAADGVSIGTLRVAEGPISTFNGVVYVQVGDIQASCRKATALGATIPPGFPFNLPDGTGAVAVVIDPAGHPVGMYSKAPVVSLNPPRP